MLDESLTSACFLNNMGDLVVGFQKQVFYIDHTKGRHEKASIHLLFSYFIFYFFYDFCLSYLFIKLIVYLFIYLFTLEDMFTKSSFLWCTCLYYKA